jgi:DeoR family transcriptional regulator, fructose operon transcriptional repressor
VMIVADHTKFGRLSLARLCGLDEVGHLVVDPGLSEEYRAVIEGAGVQIHVAPENPGVADAANGAPRQGSSRGEA